MQNYQQTVLKSHLLTVMFFLLIYSSTMHADVMVLDFELNDLTIYEDNTQELERTKKYKPLLEQALVEVGQLSIVSFDIADQSEADVGKGYLYDHHDLVAALGLTNDARWVVVGRLHKPSYLFSYLKVQLIDVTTAKLAADLSVELKGQQDKFLKKSVKLLALQINEAIEHYSQ